ncbi:hypothetical protein PIB30_028538 [Stylosanthes scabra]|uniref:Uncharacterized protein n=1 Tax=Stylosanthes scabra TaxID=79078 RepID=A0ABU6SAW2_9FABA|nr:hypothetical protein [Stylosanthes scabra]
MLGKSAKDVRDLSVVDETKSSVVPASATAECSSNGSGGPVVSLAKIPGNELRMTKAVGSIVSPEGQGSNSKILRRYSGKRKID